MEAIKGVYKNGKIELDKRPIFSGPIEVIIIFPEKKKKIKKIGGIFKGFDIDFKSIEDELKKLNKNSENHLVKKAGEL